MPQADETWTVGRLLSWTADFLKKKGAESPRLDAEVLLAHVLEWQRVQLYTRFEQEVGETDRAKFRDLVKKRAESMPVAYLVGHKEFFSIALQVSPAVLIPRPDTETAVVEALERLKGLILPKVVDVGTGSGCLALAIAKHHPSAKVIAIDISRDALDVARSNATKLGLADRVEFREGNLLACVVNDGPFDLIVSNPPYIATSEIAHLEPGVRDYEPRLALDGGDNGLRIVARLIEQAAPLLALGGHLILEIGSDQEAPVRELIANQPGWTLSPTIRDAANHPRVVRASR